MKLFFDLFPVVLFFIAYKWRDIFVATGVMMVACLVQVILFWIKHRRFEKMHLITLVVVLLFGGFTLAFRDPVFIKWKPSIVNWIFAIVFLGSPLVGGRVLVERMMGSHIDLAPRGWLRLNLSWVGFFIVCGAANIVVAYKMSEAAWVNFKLFGLTGMSIAFIAGQIFLLRDQLKPIDPEPEDDS